MKSFLRGATMTAIAAALSAGGALGQADPPRLVVIVTIDQLRAEQAAVFETPTR